MKKLLILILFLASNAIADINLLKIKDGLQSPWSLSIVDKGKFLITEKSGNIILFNDSIKNNIAYGSKNANDKELTNALKSANLYDLVSKLDRGINTIIGENGIKLSGGEKQRLSIARALVKNPQILILDEATASLDSESEKKVHHAIDNVIKDRTVIVIAHRLSTIINADKIIVMDKGRIVEQGNHLELINLDGIYKKLYELQYS